MFIKYRKMPLDKFGGGYYNVLNYLINVYAYRYLNYF